MAALTVFVPFSPLFASVFQFTSLLIVFGLLVLGGAMFVATKPRRWANALWIPFLCFYVVLQSGVSLFALVQIAFNRPGTWTKTVKTGNVTLRDEHVSTLRDI
ncbi:MAG: hypothetical protein GTO41_27960 [Burkholderiales bacterium]|nr:hypothetical protein [Burkholderiales bacterium]